MEASSQAAEDLPDRSAGRTIATVIVGVFAAAPVVALIAATVAIRRNGWPASTIRGLFFVVLLSMFVFASVSIASVANGIYRNNRRRIVFGLCGTLAAIAIYISVAFLLQFFP